MKRKEIKQLVAGAAGKIELCSFEHPFPTGVVVVCHPHPQHGGTMNNKVVTTAARAFQECGMHTIRFNYRGVGESEGSFSDGIGETEDLIAVLSWLENHLSKQPLFLAGFSFGTFVALNAMKRLPELNVEGLLLIAPPVQYFPKGFIQIPKKCLVIQSDDDEVVSAQAVYDWVPKLPTTVQLVRYQGAGHYFHGRLLELKQTIADWMNHGAD